MELGEGKRGVYILLGRNMRKRAAVQQGERKLRMEIENRVPIDSSFKYLVLSLTFLAIQHDYLEKKSHVKYQCSSPSLESVPG